jgi:hypothetical protein
MGIGNPASTWTNPEGTFFLYKFTVPVVEGMAPNHLEALKSF